METIDSYSIEGIGHIKGHPPLGIFKPKFLDTLRNGCAVAHCSVWIWTHFAHCVVAYASYFTEKSDKIFRTACQSCLADLWADKMRAAPDPFWFSGWKTWACFQAGESTGFEISCWITRQVGRRHLLKNASRPYSLYRLDLLPCRLRDPEWRLDPLWCWLA